MDHGNEPLHYGDVVLWAGDVHAMVLVDPPSEQGQQFVGVYLTGPGDGWEIGGICHTLVGLGNEWSHWEVLSCTATETAEPTSESGSPS